MDYCARIIGHHGFLMISAEELATFSAVCARIRAGDSEAMGELYTRIYPFLVSRCRWFGEERYDCAHDVFVELYEKLAAGVIQHEHLPSILRYAQRIIAGRVCHTADRNATRHSRNGCIHLGDMEWRSYVPKEHHYKCAGAMASPYSAVLSEEESAILQEQLRCMKPRDRQIIELSLEGVPRIEIKTRMCLTETQFRLMKWRALDQLKLLVKRATTAKKLRNYRAA